MNLNIIDANLGGGSLLQIANRKYVQMMSYLIKTPDGRTVMIDGGFISHLDGEYLYEKLIAEGGHVDMWFITHAHEDHFGALYWILQNKPCFDSKIKVDSLYFTFPPTEWLGKVEGELAFNYADGFLKAVERHKMKVQPLVKNTVLECGGMSFEILNDCRNYKKYNNINDTSIVIRAHFPKRDVLFLGDLAVEGGKDLIKSCGKEKIKCDIVQMAHHGQCGVDKAFYELVQPKICLYCAPDWLWDNDNGGGKNSGEWKTLETRAWMEELGVQISCPHALGDYLLI